MTMHWHWRLRLAKTMRHTLRIWSLCAVYIYIYIYIIIIIVIIIIIIIMFILTFIACIVSVFARSAIQ